MQQIAEKRRKQFFAFVSEECEVIAECDKVEGECRQLLQCNIDA